MLEEYGKYLQTLEGQNLNSLFISYLDLPITNLNYVEINKKSDKIFKNYENGDSPRIKRTHKDFSVHTFLSVRSQLDKFLTEDVEFITQIPFPDTHRNFHSLRKFGKANELDFEHSIVFNKIIGIKQAKPNLENVLKKSLDEQIQLKMKDNMDPFWWQEMVAQTIKRRK